MNCKNCGNQVNEGAANCPFCGAPLQNNVGAQTPYGQYQYNNGQPYGADQGFVGRFNALGSAKIPYLINMGLLLLSFIFLFLPHYTETILIVKASFSIFDGASGLLALFLIGYIAAAALAVVPLFLNKPYNTLFLLAEKIVSIAMFSLYLIFILVTVSDDNDRIKYGVTFLGVLYFPILIATIVLVFITSSRIKKENKNKK